ncbi:hypothetical protein [Sunxiuqinia elliptica]|uniref:Uncharacterized protein n=1 Tax=Sunxiuqinia elliptica TaxID=655355 RepID=A0A1I2IRK9_9BACT|nr:hypothetical protein [Sunxiuqinia elliptica]SFF43687.1 hypothetical protein SAMN05216283_106146 [Sunxiuqinia elliptica]
MTTKDFFILVIKLFGLYSIAVTLFVTLPQNISFMLPHLELQSTIYLILMIALVIGLFFLLIFKTPHIVRLLKLEKGFDNKQLDLGNLNTQEIVKIGIFIIGGFLIIHNLPAFISQSWSAFYTDIQSQPLNANYKSNWLISGLNVVIGYFMITNLTFITRLLRIK